MKCSFGFLLLLMSSPLCAQGQKVYLTGSVESNMMLFPQQDAKIGTGTYDNETFLTNTYADLQLQSSKLDGGLRLELTQWPMPGYEDANNDFKGWGPANVWLKLKTKAVDITAGSYYEQFGSGFILRCYEDRSLGVDNSLLGLHLASMPMKGLRLKLLSGRMRNYWRLEKSLVTGADAELALGDWLPVLQQRGTCLTLGASWVNKRESDDEDIFVNPTHKLRLPEFVNAFDVRLNLQLNGFSALAEYARKSDDPNSSNDYCYDEGDAAMLSLAYTRQGFSALLQTKRSENMCFRSVRSESMLSRGCYINHLPAFTVDQTYALAALYPYATQMDGEWAYQASTAYKVKGRLAPKFKVNYSLVRGLDPTQGYLGNGEVYYQDFDIVYEQKTSTNFEQHAMYMYQQYNKGVIQQEGGNIYSHIFVYEPKYKFSRKTALRGEAQLLCTAHESGNWAMALLELSMAPYLMLTISDQMGKCEPTPGEYGDVTHYYQFVVTGNYQSHRLQVGYGRTRAGYNCTGGICRYIPASKGFTINYNYNF